MDLNKEFTKEQREAILATNKNIKIVACAGSGKTRTIVGRIIHLLTKGTKPSEIVAITYTEKAAASLKQKIYSEFEREFKTLEGLGELFVGTIHGYCLHLLQDHNDDYKSFDILNEAQIKLFIKRYRSRNGLNKCQFFHKGDEQMKELVGTYSLSWEMFSDRVYTYKNALDIIREYGISNIKDVSIRKRLAEYVGDYEQTLRENKFFDFTSIIVETLQLMENGKFDDHLNTLKYLIVDEYQDVNESQEAMIRYMSSQGIGVCVVGDDDQTIYNWRGSRFKFIKGFEKRYSDVFVQELGTNFRSSKGITEDAEIIINKNTNRIKKTMNSFENQQYEKGDVIVKRFDSRNDEIEFILNKIQQLREVIFEKDHKRYGLDYDDIVILVSSVNKIDSLVEALKVSGFDYVVEGTQNLFNTPEILVILESFDMIFKIIRRCREEKKGLDFARLLLSSISNAPSELIEMWKSFSSLSDDKINAALIKFWNEFVTVNEYEYTIQGNISTLLNNLNVMANNLPDRVYYNIGKFTEMVNDFEKVYLKSFTPDKLINFKIFLEQDAQYMYPEGWLSPRFNTVRALRIMTYHQSKGLEFPVVFMPFLTKDSIFPLRKPGGISVWSIINIPELEADYNDNESTRRVFYVGMTRSEKFLFMTRSPGVSPTGKTPYDKPAQEFTDVLHCPYQIPSDNLSVVYPKTKDKRYSTDEIITLNFSLLKDLFDCSYKFKISNVFGFFQPLNIRMGYGKSIHDMLDYIHKNHKLLDFNDPATITNIVDKYLHLPYASIKLIEAERKKASERITDYIEYNKSKFDHIVFSEKKVEMKFNDYFFIDGRIDLIRDDIHGDITIVDFKTDKSVLSPSQIKNQLMVYVTAYENMTDEKITYIESYDVDKNTPEKIEITDQDRNDFIKKLDGAQNTIRKQNYQKLCEIDPGNCKAHCKDCKINWHCKWDSLE